MTPESKLAPRAASPGEGKEGRLALYRAMLRIRLCEESFVAPILAGEVRCPVHLATGQEAAAVGVCAALEKEDYLFGSHRSHGHYLAKGGDMGKLVAEVFCREDGCSRGRGGSMHLVAPEVGMLGSAPIVAGTISLALGAALAAKLRNDGRVAVSCFGDGATGEGVLYECLNFAALYRLPLLFVCENNLYSTHLPIRECRVLEGIASVAKPFGMAADTVDGNDVLAVLEAASRAVARARAGEGPTLLELKTYRLRGHVGPDDQIQGQHTDIRPPSEIERWRTLDPLPRIEKRLKSGSKVTDAELEAVRAECEAEVSAAHEFARKSPFPQPAELGRHVFGD